MDFIVQHQVVIFQLVGFLIVSIAANQIAKVFQTIRLPLITGLILTGVIAGPYIGGLISLDSKHQLEFINEISLAFIAFAAGAELYLKEMRSRMRSIKWNTFGQLVATFLLGTIAIYFLADWIPFMKDNSLEVKLSIAMLTATIFVARSPASAIAVINELRAKGPFVQTVMGVTVIKDFLVIILFSICFLLAQVAIGDDTFDGIVLLILLGELLFSIILGLYVVSFLLRIVLRLKTGRLIKKIFILLIGFLVFYGSKQFGVFSSGEWHHTISLEPLMICIIASFQVANFSNLRAEFIKIIEDLSTPIYVVFFTFTGATLVLDVLGDVLGIAVILMLIRIITMMIGSFVGGSLAGDSRQFIMLGWMPYVTQAGVALGLTTLVVSEFPTWGDEFSAIIIAVVVMNQFIGPPLFKWAIFKVGEERLKPNMSEQDSIKNVMIIGFESQSVALARQLQKNGCEVVVTTKKEKETIQELKDITISHITEITKDALVSIQFQTVDTVVCMLSDEENELIAELAYEFGTRDIIVRLNHRDNTDKFLALDAKIVNPSTAIVSLLDHFVRSPQATSLLLGLEQGQDTRDIALLNSDLHGITLRDLRLPSDVIILSVVRGGQTIISHGYTRLRINDILTVVGSIDSLDKVQMKSSK